MLQFWNRVKDSLLCVTDRQLLLLMNVLCLSSNSSGKWFSRGCWGRSRRLQAITDVAHFLSGPVRYLTPPQHARDFEFHGSVEHDNKMGTLPSGLRKLCGPRPVTQGVATSGSPAPPQPLGGEDGGASAIAGQEWKLFLDIANVDAQLTEQAMKDQIFGLNRDLDRADVSSLEGSANDAVEVMYRWVVDAEASQLGACSRAEGVRRVQMLRQPGRPLKLKSLQPVARRADEDAAIRVLHDIILGMDAAGSGERPSLEVLRRRIHNFTGFAELPRQAVGRLELVRIFFGGYLCACGVCGTSAVLRISCKWAHALT